MIADAAVFVADKFKQAAADRLGPTVVWAGIIAVFSTAALAFALVAAYFYLAPIFGSLEAAALLAAACVGVVAAMVVVPWTYRRLAKLFESTKEEESDALTALDDDARDAIDYFGAAKVMATAFMFGFSAARRIKT